MLIGALYTIVQLVREQLGGGGDREIVEHTTSTIPSNAHPFRVNTELFTMLQQPLYSSIRLLNRYRIHHLRTQRVINEEYSSTRLTNQVNNKPFVALRTSDNPTAAYKVQVLQLALPP